MGIEKKITEENIEAAKTLFNQLAGWKNARKVLKRHFKAHPENNNEGIVTPKVVLLDSLYSTRLPKPSEVSKHIVSLAKDELDEQLNKGDLEAVRRIRQLHIGDSKYNLLSFASKYAHFHNPKSYPLYDQYVARALKSLIGWEDNRTYARLVDGVHVFIESNDLIGYSYEDIDTYLCLAGQLEALKEGKRSLRKETVSLFKTHLELFDKLR